MRPESFLKFRYGYSAGRDTDERDRRKALADAIRNGESLKSIVFLLHHFIVLHEAQRERNYDDALYNWTTDLLWIKTNYYDKGHFDKDTFAFPEVNIYGY